MTMDPIREQIRDVVASVTEWVISHSSGLIGHARLLSGLIVMVVTTYLWRKYQAFKKSLLKEAASEEKELRKEPSGTKAPRRKKGKARP
jgi:hypothetical protein